MIHLIRRLAFERRVRPVLIEPDFKEPKLPMERLPAKWHEDDSRAFILEAQDESLNQGNAAVLANGAEAGRDPLAITPGLERIAPELLALVADNVFWRGTCVDNGVFEEGLNRYRGGIISEYRKTHSASRVVVDDHRHPPAKRPALG